MVNHERALNRLFSHRWTLSRRHGGVVTNRPGTYDRFLNSRRSSRWVCSAHVCELRPAAWRVSSTWQTAHCLERCQSLQLLLQNHLSWRKSVGTRRSSKRGEVRSPPSIREGILWRKTANADPRMNPGPQESPAMWRLRLTEHPSIVWRLSNWFQVERLQSVGMPPRTQVRPLG
jgi:hypothetical protein